MTFDPLNPSALLATLSECGVDFVVVGALAVGVHGDVRGTGDVDVMVPINDRDNKKALETALRKLDADRLPSTRGGVEQGEDAEYPTLMFNTCFGKLDILYRPDGCAPYSKIKQRSLPTSLGGQAVRVAGKDDMVSMKLAAGRPHDLQDVANMTAGEKGRPRQISLTMKLLPDVDRAWARELASARVTLFDPRSHLWLEEGYLKVEARRSDLTDGQLHQWAQALAERLYGSGLVTDRATDIEISEV